MIDTIPQEFNIKLGRNGLGAIQRIETSPITDPIKHKAMTERTDKKEFRSGNNPHDLIRCIQKDKYVWYATYDEDMSSEKFKETLNFCNDKSSPIVCLN